MTFNPHGNTTADGTLITVGLAVIDYDRREGIVVRDDYEGRDYMCQCATAGHTRAHDLVPDTDLCTSHCRHDHWYTLDTGKSFNGSRLQAIKE